MAEKRPYAAAFVFDAANCLGCDEDLHFAGLASAPAAAACPDVLATPAFGSFGSFAIEDVDGEPLLESLGVTYSPVHDDEHGDAQSDGCKTPDPMDMLDADGAAFMAMLAGSTVDAAQPVDPALLLSHPSAPFGCHATHPVCDPPRLAPPRRAEWQESREFKMTKPPTLDIYNTVHDNHSGLMSEFGGVRAWMNR